MTSWWGNNLCHTQYIHIYEDVQEMLKNREFYKDSIVTVNCTEYYPVLIFPGKESEA